MSCRVAVGLSVVGVLFGCSWQDSVSGRLFACGADSDCLPGWVCARGACQKATPPPAPPAPLGPTRLAFSSAPPSLAVGECSAAVGIELQDASATPRTSPQTVEVRLAGVGLSFFADAGCTQPIDGLLLRERGTFWLKGLVAGSLEVRASASGLESATLVVTATDVPTSTVELTGPATAAAFACVPLTARLAAPDRSTSPLGLDLSLKPSERGALFADATCQTPLARVELALNRAATIYLRGHSGGPVMLELLDGASAMAHLEVEVLPAVRRGSCSLPAGTAAVSCPVSPSQGALERTLVVFQASSAADNPGAANVRCRLSSTSAIACDRGGDSSPAEIAWQTLELPAGLTVQHLSAQCPDGGAREVFVPFLRPVAADRSFVLRSTASGGVSNSDDDFYTTHWVDGGVLLRADLRCRDDWKASVQVVEWDAAKVARGNLGPVDAGWVRPTQPAPPGPAWFVLHAVSTPGLVEEAICDRMVRAEPATGALTFARGLGNPRCHSALSDVSFERVELGRMATTQSLVVHLDPGQTLVQVPLARAVDPTRTLVFSTGQSLAGQGGGEGTFADNDVLGDMVARFTLDSPTAAKAQRDSAQGGARWTLQVLQLEPH